MESTANNFNEVKEMATKNYATFFLVSALLASAVLYGGFSMLHHVQSDYGPVILTRKGAFFVFVVAEGMTLILSIFSSLLAFLCWWNLKRNGSLRKSQKMAMLYYSVTMLTLIGMFLVHVSSTYVLHGIKLLAVVEMVAFWFFCSFAINVDMSSNRD